MLDYLAAFAKLTDEECDAIYEWRGRRDELQVRDALYRSLEEEQAAAVRARRTSEAAAILALAQAAFGDLRGLLAGLPDGLLDEVPKPGEWPLRETLRHVFMVELSYRRRTRYAADREDDQPIVMPGSLKERPLKGGVAYVLGRLAAARAESDAQLADIGPAQMTQPTTWADYPVDVRFRLHRFAGHIAEHTIQCEKTLLWLGVHPGEARMITRQVSAARGAHEHVSDARSLEQLDADHRRRAREIRPGSSGPA